MLAQIYGRIDSDKGVLMKESCAILTLHNALNYGAFLQAFALKQVLRANSFAADLVDFEGASLLQRLLLVKSKYPWMIAHQLNLLKAFDRTKERLGAVHADPRGYGTVIVGSDEVWNLANSFRHREEYFGRGLRVDQRVIAYAASSNTLTPTDFVKLGGKPGDFDRFDALSVRDKRTQRVVSEVGGRFAKVVVDPTQLLDDWTQYVCPCEKRGFILLYNMPATREERVVVERLAKRTGKKLVTVGCYNPWCDEMVYASPFEFLGYVQAADYVVTSQFHGLMFSLIFNKQFVTFHQGKGKVLDALEEYGMTSRDVTGVEDILPTLEAPIDYERVNALRDRRRAESLEWLLKSVDGQAHDTSESANRKDVIS